MRKTQHPSNTHALGAPTGMSIEECSALPVTIFKYEDGTPAIASWWTPTQEELVRINCGQPIKLTILGTMQPPVSVEVGD
jgi:hypothetical protein